MTLFSVQCTASRGVDLDIYIIDSDICNRSGYIQIHTLLAVHNPLLAVHTPLLAVHTPRILQRLVQCSNCVTVDYLSSQRIYCAKEMNHVYQIQT